MLKQFAERNRLRIQRDGEETIIPGRTGHLYDNEDGLLGVLCFAGSVRKWNGIRSRAELAGMTIHQDGDEEGSAIFDPLNPEHSRLAIRFAGIRRKRRISESQRLALSTHGVKFSRGYRGVSGARINL